MSNRREGAGFERALARKLADKGWWVHLLTQSAGGQPADLIAVHNSFATLIDCKVVSGDRFVFTRAEPNQRDAMTAFGLAHGVEESGWFAIRTPDREIWMLSYNDLVFCEYECGMKSIPVKDMHFYATKFDEWIGEH